MGLPAYRVEHLHVVGDISCSRCSVSARSQLLGLEDPFKTVAPRCSDRDPRSDGITR